jgi:hypothetical protein
MMEIEDRWQKLLYRAKLAKVNYDAAILDDRGSKKAAIEMYAANTAARRFCEAEQQLKIIQQTPGA